MRSEKITRLRRWLYQGLHGLDFPAIYFRRPLWDVIVIGLSLGGLVLSITTFTPAWRRIVFHVRRPFAALSRRRTTVPEPPPIRYSRWRRQLGSRGGITCDERVCSWRRRR